MFYGSFVNTEKLDAGIKTALRNESGVLTAIVLELGNSLNMKGTGYWFPLKLRLLWRLSV